MAERAGSSRGFQRRSPVSRILRHPPRERSSPHLRLEAHVPPGLLSRPPSETSVEKRAVSRENRAVFGPNRCDSPANCAVSRAPRHASSRFSVISRLHRDISQPPENVHRRLKIGPTRPTRPIGPM